MLAPALALIFGLAAPPPVVIACVDADPLSAAAVAVVAARVTAARVVPRQRCPAAGHRVRIVERGGTMLELQTPDGRRLRRRLPWLASAEGGWMQTAMADQLGVLAARLAGLLAEAQLSAPAGPIATDEPATDAVATPAPRPVRRRRKRPIAAPVARPTAPSTVAARPRPPAPPPPAPPPEASIIPPPPPPVLVIAAAPATVSAVVPKPRPEAGWQIGADLGARVRGAAGVAPDTALRLGWRRFMAEFAWQPAVDFDAEGRPLRVDGFAFAAGVEWPGSRSDRLRLSVPLSVLVERLTVQRLDVPSAAHTLWQGGARAGVRLALRLTGGWFLEGNVDGRVTPFGRIQVVDGPELSFNQLGARMGLGLVFLPGL